MDSSTSKPKAISELAELFAFIQRKRTEKFWGRLEIRFKDGVPFLIEEYRQIKLDSQVQV